MIVSPPPGRRHALFVIASALALSACSGDAPPPAPPPPEVSVVTVKPGRIDVADELPGRVVAFRVAEIRPQVNGLIQRRLFEQGTEVRAGQPLYQINPAPFRADADSAAAAVQRARATLSRASLQEKRLAPLVKADAVSGQDYDDVVAARDQAVADLAASQADLARRRVDLGFATVRAPISGRIDQAVFTEGALASMTSEQPLATVQQIDRVYVDVRQPATRLEMLREAARAGTANQGAPVELVSSNGHAYPVKGRLLFSGISVDPNTGEVIARVEVPNPERALLPGMFVRARLPRLSLPDAIAIPRQAVTRDPKGGAMVTVVGKDGKTAARPVVTGDEQNGNILIQKGLRAGDTVIVEGQDRVQPGAAVKPVPWQNPSAAQR
ncbi:efflux RND transporter periplasmic adaptor subunit [Sphingobium sp. CR28]|uniref:efflux RND transporter periplasmic adaptor subunit n=1 Tax=Sphingobium sp. CR28 TaxID=3400272 RepID=UPI003FEE7B0A